MFTIADAASHLQAGQLVAMPTETVYGLAADATNPDAVASIFTMKGRPSFNPLIVHVADVAAAKSVATWNDQATQLASVFWPGPLTMVLPLKQPTMLAGAVTAGLDTVAIRCPAHPLARELLKAVWKPLAAPSANPSGQLSPTAPPHVTSAFGDAVPVLDGGACAGGIESTIVDVSIAGKWRILRPGTVMEHQLQAVLKMPPSDNTTDAIIAPGQLTRHYSPATPLRLNAVNVLPEEGGLAFGPHQHQAAAVENLSETGDLAEAAARLFACLHRLDALNLPGIAVMPILNEGLGVAINDRLQRAAAS